MKKIISLLLALVLTLSACSVALAADVVLRPGDKGDAVKEVQTLLTSYGYYSGKINGSYNTATTTAVRNFQRYNNELPIDGKVGEDTLNRMKSSAAIKAPVNQKDSYSTENKHIQERLKYYGYYTGRVDGIYGSGSIAAVKAFQRANGLKVDGAVGPLTLAKLDSNNAVSKKDADQATDVGTRPILRPGDKEAAKIKYIKEVQTILKAKGLYTGEIDGVYSGIIVTAVRLFQQQNGLTIDGRVGANTWKVLLGGTVTPSVPVRPSVLRPGDKNAYVKELQQNLVTLGYSNVPVDGVYGAKTTAAVKALQRKHALDVDGKAGPKTLAKINELLNAASTPSDPDANG